MNIYETLLNPKALPVPKSHCRAHYEGSIDKTGGNADWDWNLYQDENGEWVLFAFGAGMYLQFCPAPLSELRGTGLFLLF